MHLLLAIVTIAMIIGWGLVYLILKEINSITTQLEFITENKTNMIVTSKYNNSIRTFINRINLLIENTSMLRRDYIHKENNLKDTLTSLSHDIRTPLTSLDGYFQLLFDTDSSIEKDQYKSIIKEQIDSLKDMIDTLFTYVKLQNNSYKLELKRCCVNEILMDCLFGFYQKLNNEGMEPKLKISDRQLHVLANKNALKRVFQNLIKNCIEHGNGDMEIELEDSCESINISFSNHFENNGLNIKQVFNMFYKADEARSHTSTGLGLAIVKELIENFCGNVEARAEDDKFQIIVRLTKVSFR